MRIASTSLKPSGRAGNVMIPLLKVFMPADIDQAITEILHSGMLAFGNYSIEFEKKVSDYLANDRFVSTSSFNAAMVMALQLAGVSPGDEVISSPMSCLATNQPIVTSKAKVVWADIDPESGTLDPNDVEKKITTKTRAIVHYHWAGYPGHIDEVNQVARKAGIKVIEDASEAFGAEYRGKRIGNTGSDMVCFSFQTVRSPNTIDGGGIAFRDKGVYEESRLVRDYGIDRISFRDDYGEISPKCDIRLEGYGATMNNLSGIIGCRQMDHLSDILEKQAENGAAWDEYFCENEIAVPLKPLKATKPNYWVYSVFAQDRDKLLKKFRSIGFYASKFHLRNDLYSVFGMSEERLPGVTSFNDRILCLPCGWWFDRRTHKIYSEVLRDSH